MTCKLPAMSNKDMYDYVLFTVTDRCMQFEEQNKQVCKENEEMTKERVGLINENAKLAEEVVKLKNRILQLGGSDKV